MFNGISQSESSLNFSKDTKSIAGYVFQAIPQRFLAQVEQEHFRARVYRHISANNYELQAINKSQHKHESINPLIHFKRNHSFQLVLGKVKQKCCIINTFSRSRAAYKKYFYLNI